MSGAIKVNATAISHAGKDCKSSNARFYLNGKFVFGSDFGNVQASMENSLDDYIFAVCENMEREKSDKSASVSIIDQLRKYQEKTKANFKDINTRLDEVYGCIKEVDNLLHSMEVGASEKPQDSASFSGIVLVGDKAAVTNLGSSRAYLVRGDRIKRLLKDTKKADRLVKLGIITEEQPDSMEDDPEMFAEPLDAERIRSDMFVVENGDILFLCNEAFISRVNEARVLEVLKSRGSTDYLAGRLMEEALKLGNGAGITILLARIHKSSSSINYDFIKPLVAKNVEAAAAGVAATSSSSADTMRHFNKLSGGSRRRRNMINSFISTTVVIAILVVIVFACYNSIKKYMKYSADGGNDKLPTSTSTVEDTSPATDGPTESTSGEPTESTSGEPTESRPTESPSITPTPKATQAPVATATPKPPVQTGQGTSLPTTYIVKSGDNLRKIAEKFYGDPEKYPLIMKANGISNANQIQLGAELIIPKPE